MRIAKDAICRQAAAYASPSARLCHSVICGTVQSGGRLKLEDLATAMMSNTDYTVEFFYMIPKTATSFNWFSESTNSGMRSLVSNAAIFPKVNVPKYLFLFSGNVQAAINFVLTLLVFFFFCWMDDVTFTWRFVFLLYPILTLLVFNIGVGMILSALYIFFRDMDYLWGVFIQLLMYGSAIFYQVDKMSPAIQQVFAFNPVYRHIAYVREIVLNGAIPSLTTHLTLAGFALAAFLIGAFMYKRYNTRFLYYV